MNTALGKTGFMVTALAVLAFAVSMAVSSIFASCLSSMFIALGYVIAVCALAAPCEKDAKGMAFAAAVFAGIYAAIILLVYFSECTTVRLNPALSEEALSLISYGHAGSLFFNYDLLGYAMMALSTFFISFTVNPAQKAGKPLRFLLRLHGVFFLPCFLVPMFPVFTGDTSPLFGVLLLETWCAYFLPVCILGYRYFNARRKTA